MWTNIVAWAWLFSPPFLPAAPLELRLVAQTGAVELLSPREIRGVAGSGALPLKVPPGSKIVVLSGRAIFAVGDALIRARAGDRFHYRLVARGGVPSGIELAASGPATGLIVESRGSSIAMNEGDALSLLPLPDGRLEVQARAGYLTLSEPGRDRTLAPGQAARLPTHAPPPPDELPPPEPALAPLLGGEGIVEPGEVLRSALGPKPKAEPVNFQLDRCENARGLFMLAPDPRRLRPGYFACRNPEPRF